LFNVEEYDLEVVQNDYLYEKKAVTKGSGNVKGLADEMKAWCSKL